jgi:hypothetical protein
MSVDTSSATQASRDPGSPARSRLPRFLAGLLFAIAVAVPLAGIAYLVNGATQAKGDVSVQVQTRALNRLSIPLTVGKDDDTVSPLHQTTPDTGVVLFGLPGVKDTMLEAKAGTLTMQSWDSTVLEQLTARGGTAVSALCVGGGAFLLRTLMLSTAAGHPFQHGNAARIAGVAGLIAVAAVASAVLPYVSAELVFHRIGLSTAGSAVAPPPLLPGSTPVHLLVALLVLALAGAFRRGRELARDVDGLV